MALKAKSKIVDGVRVDINTGVPIKQSTPEQQRNLIALNKLNSGQPPAQSPPVPVPTAGYDIEGMAKGAVDSYNQQLSQRAEQAKQQEQQSFEQLLTESLDAEGLTSRTNKEYAETGVNQFESELQDINNQILQEQESLRKAVERIQTAPGTATATERDRQVSELERVSLRKQADLAVIQLSRQGKYDSAKAIADRAVQAQVERQSQKLSILQLAYERNKDLFTKAEQREFESMQADRQRALDMEAQKEMLRYEAMIKSGTEGGVVSPYFSAPTMSFEEYLSQKEAEMGMNIDPTSPLYQQIQQEYTQGTQQLAGVENVGLMASNLRSLVAKTGPAATIFDKAYANAASQGVDSAEKFLRAQYINNVLSGTERENYNNVQNGLEMYREAIKFLEDNPDLQTGFWIETTEGLKPKFGIKKDPRYATFLSLVNQAEAPIRKAQYGTAITGTELSLALRSLLNTDDDRNVTLLKMQQAVAAYDNGLNRNMSNALGTAYSPKPIPTPNNQQAGPIAGEDIYTSVVGNSVDYNQVVDDGMGQILNQLFIGY